MTAEAVPYGRVTQKKPAVAEVHIRLDHGRSGL